MDKHPLMELVITLYEPYYKCKDDRLLVMFHFLMIQHGYRVADNIRQVSFFIFKDRCRLFFWICYS